MQRIRRHTVILSCFVVAALAAALACSSSKKHPDPMADLKTAIDKDVADRARAAKMSASVDEMTRLSRESISWAARKREALAPMLTDYGTSREKIEARLAELDVERTAIARRVIDAHLAFKAAATAAEWKKLKGLEDKALARVLEESTMDRPLVGKEG